MDRYNFTYDGMEDDDDGYWVTHKDMRKVLLDIVDMAIDCGANTRELMKRIKDYETKN